MRLCLRMVGDHEGGDERGKESSVMGILAILVPDLKTDLCTILLLLIFIVKRISFEVPVL